MKRTLIQNNEPAWAFMRRVVIPDIKEPNEDYLIRWKLIATPWFSIFLHKILLHDRDVNLHDHPWNFISFILWGGYVELRGDMTNQPEMYKRLAWSWNKMQHWGFHKITYLLRRPTWTLVFTGRRVQDWGYYTKEDGWISHTQYNWKQYNTND